MPARRRPARRTAPVVLVYHPDEADAYAALIRPPRGRAVHVHVCATEAEAAAVVGEVDVVYALEVPARRSTPGRRAPARGCRPWAPGVDWVLVPELPPRVVVTRAPGVFGPWMSEYVLGWCSWVTQRMETYRAGAARAALDRDRRCPAGCAARRWRWSAWATSAARSRAWPRAVGMRVIGVSRSGRPRAGGRRASTG